MLYLSWFNFAGESFAQVADVTLILVFSNLINFEENYASKWKKRNQFAKTLSINYLIEARKCLFPSLFPTILKTLSSLGLHIDRFLKIGEKLGS